VIPYSNVEKLQHQGRLWSQGQFRDGEGGKAHPADLVFERRDCSEEEETLELDDLGLTADFVNLDCKKG
jgi:hypothetical protein